MPTKSKLETALSTTLRDMMKVSGEMSGALARRHLSRTQISAWVVQTEQALAGLRKLEAATKVNT